MTLHKEIIGAQIHVIYNWSYADATARLAATGFVVGDVGKVAYQASDSTLWLLTDDSPIVWAAVAGSTYTNEEAQDAVGTILADSASINFTYTDATPEITAVAIFGSSAGTVTQGNDARLSDARTPTAHTHPLADVSDVTASAAEVNLLDGVTASTAELNILDGVTATAAELNALDGITASVAELNHTDGVTSAIQGQIDGKQPLDADLTALAGLTSAADKLPYFTGSGTAALADLSAFVRTFLDDADAATVRTTIGAGTSSVALPIAESDVTNLTTDLANKQPLDSDLTTIAGLTATTDNFMVSAASAWASRTPAQAKTSLALVKGDVGLGNVDNTSDAAKPVSTATQTALDLKADESAVVHDTGNETIAGIKTFSSDPLIPDEVYGVGWNGSLEPPTKNAVYDKIESLPPTKTATIDFGTTPLSDLSFTVTDASIATTSKIIASISSFTGFARSMDEVYADPISFTCEPLAGSMTVRAQAFLGRVTGTYPIVYSIA